MIALLLGFFGGALASFIGIGAGSIYVPAFISVLGFSPFTAQALSLGIIFPISLFSGYLYARKGFVSNQHVKAILPLALLGVLMGTFIAYILPSIWLKRAFGLYLLFVAIRSWREP